MSKHVLARAPLALALLAAVHACATSVRTTEPSAVSGISPAGASRASVTPVRINFAAMVGDEPFACGRSYDAIGTGNSRFTPSEFRMFVSDVALLTADGRAVPVALDQDGLWQNGEVAMLDFEDGSGPCSNGTAALRTEVTGHAPAARYTGVRFTIGVPFERNHRDLASQPSPLSVTRMFWSWNAGHKFVRLDGRTETGKNWVLHLGSTGCAPTGSATTAATSCLARNAPVVELRGLDLARDVIVADVRRLYAASDLESNQERTAAGCMSGPSDRDCAPIFTALGLAFGEAAPVTQRFMRVERAATTQGHAP